MSNLILHSLPVPTPREAITIRPGEMRDVPFLDSLQKLHTKQVGWMPTKQFEGKIKLGHVLVAEELVGSGQQAAGSMNALPSAGCQLPAYSSVGYLIGNDQYFKRDDVGIIYQVNVVPGKQRSFIGAALLKAQFERSAYGCKLYCCWCAQDIAANKFWEAMGFVPLAYRAGSEKKARVHIFWQKRIRQGDTTTSWWFPSQTTGGSIREDRLVLPIPPGTHWSDAKPVILPGTPREEPRRLPTPRQKAPKPAPAAKPEALQSGGLWFRPAKPAAPQREPKPPKVKQKNDPRLIAAARELRDRWLEQVNANPTLLLPGGKYDASRPSPVEAAPPLPSPGAPGEGLRMLPAA